MRTTWTGLERAAWDDLHRGAAGALQQDWAYGEAMAALGTRCARVRIEGADGAPVAIAQALLRRVAGLVPIVLFSHGPVWTPGTGPEARREALRALRREAPFRWPRVLLATPDAPLGDAAEWASWRRVMTGHATVRIDLAAAPEAIRAAMHGKWRNRLAAAERSALRVERVGARPAQYRWLLERELAQRTRRGYVALPDGFVEAWQAAHPRGAEPLLALRADLGREAAAGMLFLVHGAAATYQVGWVGDAGRELGAHNLLLWRAIGLLRERGVRTLDLGGVDTARGAGLARFKIGTGGAVVTLAGTYCG
jgi:glyoxylase-like metal-dependent hydrolase (beta-lactamase superfamily II)